MLSISDRLKEERARLGISQAALAEIGGVVRRAQQNYESGLRTPDGDYFSKVAKIGIDVLYVITGVRQGEYEPMAHDEAALLDNYRHSSEEGKKAIRATSDSLAQSASKVSARRKIA